MLDHVRMLVQNFWVRGDVVFTAGEAEKSILTALECGMSGSNKNYYPKIKDEKSSIILNPNSDIEFGYT